MSEQIEVKGFQWDLEILSEQGEVTHKESQHNLIPTQGMDFLVRSPFGDTAPISTFYLGLFRGNYIPTPATSAVDIPTNMNEFVEYSEAERPLWERSFAAPSSMDNAASKASFTITQDRTIYGAFLVSDPTKGGNSGLVLSCVRFASPQTVTAGQVVNLSGGLTYISTNVI